ncbi:hypothetical protein C2S51_013059 [Perilla frutescens var. frutescens]|nr:hypothetical protein C2S51_013059 [Perilla frutescens var. frutescens]
MKFGRPDSGYLKWRWKPDGCELPLFEPGRFLEMVRGKSLAFVGDSVARNHMQSLICLLSKVAWPLDISDPTEQNNGSNIETSTSTFPFSGLRFWRRPRETAPPNRPFDVYLDEFDDTWTTRSRLSTTSSSPPATVFPAVLLPPQPPPPRLPLLPGAESNIAPFRRRSATAGLFRTAFRAINAAAGFNGVVFLRTFAPSHFEGGAWDQGGNCLRTRPFKRNETELSDSALEFYTIQLEELGIARKAGRRNGGKLALFDTTKPMLLRPDGHPSKYGHWPGAKLVMPNDCVHWCLPGPIDAWSDFLQELLKRETV